MKKRDIIIYSCIMIACSVFALEVVARTLTGSTFIPDIKSPFSGQAKETVDRSFRCSDRAEVANLEKSTDPQLKKLAEYQSLCGSLPSNHMMIFTDMPKDDIEAKAKAQKMAVTLKEFASFNIRPIVIIEPVASWGYVDFEEFKSGFYTPWLATYFKTLRAEGITDQTMGIWVPFPEANLPYWNRNNAAPEDFGAMVNVYLSTAKATFPNLEASILLNSATYSADDFDWERGEYISLMPYVKNIQKGLVQSFGLQGFPWAPPANRTGQPIFDASEFLNYKLAQEAADTLGVKKIWFNTGTFKTKYAGDELRVKTVAPEKRADILTGVLTQAKTLQEKGYEVSVNLFAENKNNSTEATDWSYFTSNTVRTSPGSPVFTNFAARLHEAKIDLWLFDRTN